MWIRGEMESKVDNVRGEGVRIKLKATAAHSG